MIIKINGTVNINNDKIKMDNLSIEIDEANIDKKEEEKNLPREANNLDYTHIANMVIEGSKENLQNIIADLIKKASVKTM